MSTRLYVEFSENEYVDEVLFLEKGTYDKYLWFVKQSVFIETSSVEKICRVKDSLRKNKDFVEFSKSFYHKHNVEDIVENGKLTNEGLIMVIHDYIDMQFPGCDSWNYFGLGRIDTTIYGSSGSETRSDKIYEILLESACYGSEHAQSYARMILEEPFISNVVRVSWF